MSRSFTTLTILLVASFAYGQGQTLNKSLMHNGIRRNYTIYVPSGYSPGTSTPLVVNMHGLSDNRQLQMTYSGMNAVAEREGFLVVYPDAVNADWFGPHDNIGFIDGLLNDVSSQYAVNTAKVYATGVSQGGIMSYLLSVELPDRFAAVASVSGTRPVLVNGAFFEPDIATTPDRPFPLLHIHGTSDPLVRYNGGAGAVPGYNFTVPPVERVISDYVTNNGGDETPTTVELPNINTRDGSTVRRISYEGANYLDSAGNSRQSEVVLYRIQNGGHNWPGDYTPWPGWAGTVNYDISASTEIWNFFSRHELPLFPTWNVDADGQWSLAANWSGLVPNAQSARATLADVITAPRTVMLDVPITVGHIKFDSLKPYTIAGTSPLALDVRSGNAQFNVTRGNHTISAPVTLANPTIINVAGPTSSLSMTGPLNSTGVQLTKAGTGVLTVNNVRAAALALDGGTLAIASNGTDAGTSRVSALSIAGTTTPAARLDLNNNALVVDYTGTSPVAAVRQRIVAGRGGAGLGKTWNGPGITSSAAAAAEAESRSIGYAENSALPLGPYTTFRGQAVDGTAVMMALTRTGDANLDGVVNDDDVTIVGASYAPGVSQPHWAHGDFDYNGFVDDDDVTLLGAFYEPSAAPLAAPAPLSGTSISGVPEPATFWLLVVTSAGLACGRRCRRILLWYSLAQPTVYPAENRGTAPGG
ncbi:MAG: PHB depolymerase family esterase [Pirellulales bacterium]